jgi:hypothetical protein
LITASDIICVPFTPDLAEAGIGYACRSLPYSYDRTESSPFDRLRRIVTEIAVELAFRRYLTQQNVPFDTKGATPFTEPNRYDVSLGGHRCDIRTFLISDRAQITALHADPAALLQAPALVPVDQFAGEGHSPTDLYLFAFLTGLVAASRADVEKACNAGQPIFLVHPMPESWMRPHLWASLGKLVLKSESSQPLIVELGGQNAAREFITFRSELAPHTRLELHEDFHSIAYVHIGARTEGRVGIYSSSRHATYLIRPVDWGNIWVYGLRAYLVGCIGRDEFRQKARMLPADSRAFQFERTRTKDLALPVSELRSLPEFLGRARAWSAAHSNAPR